MSIPQSILANGFHFNRRQRRSNFDKENAQVSLLGTLGGFSSVRVEVSGRNSATVAQVKDLIAAAPDLLAACHVFKNQLDSLANCTTREQTGLIDPRESPAYLQAAAALLEVTYDEPEGETP